MHGGGLWLIRTCLVAGRGKPRSPARQAGPTLKCCNRRSECVLVGRGLMPRSMSPKCKSRYNSVAAESRVPLVHSCWNWYFVIRYIGCFHRHLEQTGCFHHDSTGQFPTIVFENLCRTCGVHTPHAWITSRATGRIDRATLRLCRNLQFSAPRYVADSGGSAARKWTWHSPFPGESRNRGDDARWHLRAGHKPKLPGFECFRNPPVFCQ